MELPADGQGQSERNSPQGEQHLRLDSPGGLEFQADYSTDSESQQQQEQQQQQQQQQQSVSSSAREQVYRRRTLQSPVRRISAQPQGEDTQFLQRRRSSRLSRFSSFLRKRDSTLGGPTAAASEAMSRSSSTSGSGSSSSSSSAERTPTLQKEYSTARAPIPTHQSGSNSSTNNNRSSKGSTTHISNSACSTQSSGKGFTSCAPWRVTLIIEAFDAGSIGCPACVPLSAAAEAAAAEGDDENAFPLVKGTAAAAVASAHADDSTLRGSSPPLRSRRSSNSPRDTLSSTSSMASLPTASSSSNGNSSSEQNTWCCSCAQIWVEVQDVRAPGTPAQLRLLSDSLLAPQHLSPPILLRRRMRQLQFRLFRRRPWQRRTLHSIELEQQQQQVEWVEERELLGMRAVSLPASRSCVISCTFGIAGCKIVAPADPSLLQHSLTLALAASHPSWDWLRLKRPDPPLSFKDVDDATEPRHTSSALSPLCRWLRLSIRSCGSDSAAALLAAAAGVYGQLLQGADCLRLVASAAVFEPPAKSLGLPQHLQQPPRAFPKPEVEGFEEAPTAAAAQSDSQLLKF
ncbi:hypothetical protein ACSSS7_001113 [Eimeria intestinalis]